MSWRTVKEWIVRHPMPFAALFAVAVLGPIGLVRVASESGAASGGCNAPVSVSVVGDSMFEVGEERLRFRLGDGDSWDIVSWDAESGRSIRDHPSALTQTGKIVVTSFAYNDVNLGGTERLINDAEQFLEAYADRTVIWVTFADLEHPEIKLVNKWIRRQGASDGVEIADFGAIHQEKVAEWNHSFNEKIPWAGIHLDPNLDGVVVLADTIRESVDSASAAIQADCRRARS